MSDNFIAYDFKKPDKMFNQSSMKSVSVGNGPFDISTLRVVYIEEAQAMFLFYNVDDDDENILTHPVIKWIFFDQHFEEVFIYKLEELELSAGGDSATRTHSVTDKSYRQIFKNQEDDGSFVSGDTRPSDVTVPFQMRDIFGVCDAQLNQAFDQGLPLDVESDRVDVIIKDNYDSGNISYNIVRTFACPYTVFDLNFNEEGVLVFKYSEHVRKIVLDKERIVHDGYFWEETPLEFDKRFRLPLRDPDRFYTLNDPYYDNGYYFRVHDFMEELKLYGVPHPGSYITDVGIRKDIVDGYAKYGTLELWHKITDTTTLSIRQVIQMLTYEHHDDYLYHHIEDIPENFLNFLTAHDIDPHLYVGTVGVSNAIVEQLWAKEWPEIVEHLQPENFETFSEDAKKEFYKQQFQNALDLAQRTMGQDDVERHERIAMQYNLISHANKKGYKILNKFSTPTLDMWPYVNRQFDVVSQQYYFTSKSVSKHIDMKLTQQTNITMHRMRLVRIPSGGEDAYVIYYNVTNETQVLDNLLPEHLNNLRSQTSLLTEEGYKKNPVSIFTSTPEDGVDTVYSSEITKLETDEQEMIININSQKVIKLEIHYSSNIQGESGLNSELTSESTTQTPTTIITEHSTATNTYAQYANAAITSQNLLGVVDASIITTGHLSPFIKHFGKSRFRYTHEVASLFKFNLKQMQESNVQDEDANPVTVDNIRFTYEDLIVL